MVKGGIKLKHAVLVLAHGDLSILKLMLNILDDERFDFYIHIDAKSVEFNPNDLDGCTKKAKVFFTERIPVFWGHFSLVEAELLLLKAAVNSGVHYDYYHLLSGADMPLKTANEIDDFFRKRKGKQFVVVWRTDKWRMNYQYPFITMYKRSSNERINKLKKGVISRVLRFPRKKGTNIQRDKGWIVYCGDEWWSGTDQLAEFIVAHEKEIAQYWNGCYIADECLIPTIIKNIEEFDSMLVVEPTREIRWVNCTPYVWREGDLRYLLNSTALFARKFSTENINVAIQIADVLKKRKNEEVTLH